MSFIISSVAAAPEPAKPYLQEINKCHFNDPLHIISWLMDCILGGIDHCGI